MKLIKLKKERLMITYNQEKIYLIVLKRSCGMPQLNLGMSLGGKMPYTSNY